MRPTTSRQERLMERDKAGHGQAHLPPSSPVSKDSCSSSAVPPTSAYYLPEPDESYPPLPPDSDDSRDHRLFASLKLMMQIYHLNQHDVCISSNLSGGQAALSSMLNSRPIANIGRKQNQLRKWLFKFETYQTKKLRHVLAHALPKPAPGVAGAVAFMAAGPAMRNADGSVVQVGAVVTGHTEHWPPTIHWKSYFEPLTAAEIEAQQAHKAAEAEAARHRVAAMGGASKASSSGLRAHKSARLSPGDPESPSFSVPGPALSRLRTVHHAPAKFTRSVTPEAGAAAAAAAATHQYSGAMAAAASAAFSFAHSGSSLPSSPSKSALSTVSPVSAGGHKRKSLHPEIHQSNSLDGDLFSHRYNIGSKLDCRVTPASDSAWLGCQVKEVRSCAILLQFMRAPENCSQWVYTRSKRLAEFGQYSGEKKQLLGQAQVDELARAAHKEYLKCERAAARDGYTAGAPLWSGKKRPELKPQIINSGKKSNTLAPAQPYNPKKQQHRSGSSSAAEEEDADEPDAHGQYDYPERKSSPDSASGSSSSSSSSVSASSSDVLLHGPGGVGSKNINADDCSVCGKGGNLLCCDGCPSSFHGPCLDPPVNVKTLSEEDPWFCAACAKKKRQGPRPRRTDSMAAAACRTHRQQQRATMQSII